MRWSSNASKETHLFDEKRTSARLLQNQLGQGAIVGILEWRLVSSSRSVDRLPKRLGDEGHDVGEGKGFELDAEVVGRELGKERGRDDVVWPDFVVSVDAEDEEGGGGGGRIAVLGDEGGDEGNVGGCRPLEIVCEEQATSVLLHHKKRAKD